MATAFAVHTKFRDESAKAEMAVVTKLRKCLYGAAGYTQKIMKQRMKRRKAISAAGGYPSSHHEGQLKNLIFFSVDENMLSLIVGPALYPGSKDTASHSKTVPQLVNEGGTAIRTFNKGKDRFNPRQVVQVYQPRPFTNLTMPDAIAILHRNIERESL